MKITKRQLKRIIKEELRRVIEGSDEAIEAFNDYIQRKDPGQMIVDALADYEDPAPEGDPLGDLPYEDPADRPDPFADLMQ